MDTFLLTDWLTVRTRSDSPPIVQSAYAWLDLPEHEDVIFYLDVKEVTGTVFLSYDTSPARHEGSFVSMLSFTTTPGLRIDRVPFRTALVPLARFLRWSMSTSSPGTSDATFRIWIAAYSYE
jgi:hypothetical protein